MALDLKPSRDGGPTVLVEPSTGETVETMGVSRERRAMWLRRCFLIVLAVFVVLGLLGVFGIRHRQATARAGDLELTVDYPAVVRGGLSTQWALEVRQAGGFEGPVSVAVTQSFLELFDQHLIAPEPSDSTTAGDTVVWQFEPPAGDTLSVVFEGTLEPGMQIGHAASVAVLGVDAELAAVQFSTTVLP